MRLSQAILLGSTLLRAKAIGDWEDDEGCALQMAVAATVGLENVPTHMKVRSGDLRCEWQHAWDIWPWSAREDVAGKFDRWMREGKSTDSFVDYVRSIEPAEPEEESDGPDPFDFAVEDEMEKEARYGQQRE